MKFLLPLLLVLSTASANIKLVDVPAYGQCGGQNYEGSTVCAAGFACYTQNAYYSQCLPPVPPFGQCGGATFGGATQCVSGYSCVVQGPYYSQCLVTAPTTPLMCYTRTPEQVRALYTRWNSMLQTLDSSKVADEYWDDSVLLPTVSNVIRFNRALKVEYFDDFLKKKPSGVIVEDFVDNKGCNYVVYNGKYDFSLTSKGVTNVTPARFTYVFTTEDGVVWKIKTHHSSVLPEPVYAPSAAPITPNLRG
eukprot:gene29759-39471_t